VSVEPIGTLRVIGIAANGAVGRVTLVLVETDGLKRVRLLETHTVTLATAAGASTVERSRNIAEAVLQFIGNLVLQPFAVDAIGLSGACAERCDVQALAHACHVAVLTPCDATDPRDPEAAAAVAAYLAARTIRLRTGTR
jgi:hypothetical protein